MENDEIISDEEYFMTCCEYLGAKAASAGNPPVGAVIVQAGRIIAEGEEAGRSKNDISCHAELEALRAAVRQLQTNDLSDCTMYTTHEPCVMCSYAIRYYRISKLVYRDPVLHLGGIHSATSVLTTRDVPPHWSDPPVTEQFVKRWRELG